MPGRRHRRLHDITVCPDALVDDAVNRLVAYCTELRLNLNREQDSAERPALRILGCAIAEDPTQAALLLQETRPLGDYEPSSARSPISSTISNWVSSGPAASARPVLWPAVTTPKQPTRSPLL
jgi:hypothetical protein